MIRHKWAALVFVLTAITAAVFFSKPSYAHCDGLDGPVVIAAQKALTTENLNHVLYWVPQKDEAEVRRAFEHTLKVRKLGAEAKALADIYFFETVVRLHRAYEGAPYTGLKPAGRDMGPAIPAADKSLETRSSEQVEKLLIETIRQGLHERFHATLELQNFSANDVEAGRRYVEAYVPYIHYVEGLWAVASSSSEGHAVEGSATPKHSH